MSNAPWENLSSSSARVYQETVFDEGQAAFENDTAPSPSSSLPLNIISKMAIKLFFTWLFASFPSLIQHLLPYLEGQLIFIHDMASISTYFSLFPAFSYEK